MEGRRFGRYVLESQIGLGGMGVVYVATDTHLDRHVALKILSGQFAAATGFRERFQREAATLARLDSPHVIAIFDHGEQDGVPWLATQLVRGGDLDRLLAARGPLPPEIARSVCQQVAEALTDAHHVGVVHRDIKPSNVLVRDPDAERLHVYLCDFGIALDESSGRLTTVGSVFGTWSYLAPERSQGRPATPTSDVYSLGCLLWACLTGQAPYVGTDVGVAMAHVHAPVRQLVGDTAFAHGMNEVLQRSMAKDPAARYASTADLRRALADVPQATGPVAARPAPPTSPPPGAPPGPPLGPPPGAPPTTPRSPVPGSTVPRPVGPRRRGRRGVVLAAAAAVVAVLVAVTVLVVVTTGDDGPERGPSAGSSEGETDDVPVTNDVNGDGRGDAVAYLADGERRTRYTFSSTGQTFLTQRTALDGFEYPVYLDLADNGTLDRLDAIPTGDGRMRLDSTESRLDGQTFSGIELVSDPELNYVEVLTGDFDGDGEADLLVWGQTAELEITVWVLAGEGPGRLGPPEVWARIDGQHVYTTFLRAADFDGDGATDVLATLPDGRPELGRSGATWEGESGFQVYRSTGEEFTPDGRLNVLSGLTYATVVVGDFAGDDRPRVAVSDFDTATVVLYSLEEDDRRPRLDITVSLDDPSADAGQLEMLPSDVDGDRDDDLVLTKTGRKAVDVFVARSEDGKLAEPESWGELPPCQSAKAADCRFSWFLST